MIAILTFIGAIIGLFPKSDPVNNKVINQNNIPITTTNNNQQTNTTINNENNIGDVINYSNYGNDKNVDKVIEYSIIGTSNKKLITAIENNQVINIVPNSSNKIEVTYEGSVTKLNENSNSYYFTGGYLIININDNKCYEFKNFIIKDMRPNSKDIINNEINNIIELYVEKNVNLMSKKIIECAKN